MQVVDLNSLTQKPRGPRYVFELVAIAAIVFGSFFALSRAFADDSFSPVARDTISAERAALVHVGSGCSGVCVSPDGYILTAKHCISKAGQSIDVTFDSLGVRPATVAHVAVDSDLAVLRVFNARDLPCVRLAQSAPTVGESVYSLGYPAGQFAEMDGHVTQVGLIKVAVAGERVPLFGNPYHTYNAIQTSHRILGGNSGGPLFNCSGEVVGIASLASMDGQQPLSIWMHTASLHSALTAAGFRSTSSIAAADDPAKPTLYVFTLPGCKGCNAFKLDYGEGRTEFGRALDAMFTVQFVDLQQSPDLAKKFKIKAAPAFAPSNGNGWTATGYRTGQQAKVLSLLQKFGVKEYSRDRSGGSIDLSVDLDVGGGDSPSAIQPAPITPIPDSPPENNAAAVDWTAVTVIICVKQQDVSDLGGSALSVLERVAQGSIKRAINEQLNGNASIEVVFQRTHPERFKAVLDAAGIGDYDVAVAVAVEKQFEGLKGFVVGKVEAAIQSVKSTKFRDVPVEVIFQRTSEDDFEALKLALATEDIEEESDSGIPEGDSPLGLLWGWFAAGFGGGGSVKLLDRKAKS